MFSEIYFGNSLEEWIISPLNYWVDVGYSYRKSFGDKLLLLRLGVYNVVGNPSEEDILSFYSVHWSGNCLPYGSLSFKF
jgi:hypothetical protein